MDKNWGENEWVWKPEVGKAGVGETGKMGIMKE